ncbi:MAG: hypothetical protein K6E13_08230 [Lachnospiraceae bacterium]|nr:hypothetical protein [Lachnospiraceae bacterium]
MKKRYLLIMALCAVCISAAGCDAMGSDQTTGSPAAETEKTTEEADADDVLTNVSIEGIDEAASVLYSDIIQKDTEEGSTFEEQFTLICLNDTEAKFIDSYNYSGSYRSTFEYMGTYEKKDDSTILFTSNEKESSTQYTITVADGKITSAEMGAYDYGVSEIVGEYTAESDEFGRMTLKVEETGSATLTAEDGTSFDGTLMTYQDKWDFMTINDDNGAPGIDWIVEFNGSNFTYIDYTESIYGAYEGTYTMSGDLGEITVVVERNGTSTTTVNIEGVDVSFTGTPNFDYETQELLGFYLYSDDGYSLDLSIVKLEDGTLNYSGSITKPLNAG